MTYPRISSEYLPEGIKEQELYKEVVDLMDFVLEKNEDEVRDILLKYKDQASITAAAQQSLINELGADYIGTIVNEIASGELDVASSYIIFILLLKGHRDGVELVLNLLFFDFEVIEHWEYDKDRSVGSRILYIGEFKIDIDSFGLDQLALLSLIRKLNVFFRNYVYPIVLINILVEGEYNGVFPSTGYAIKVLYDTYETEFISINSDTFAPAMPFTGQPTSIITGNIVTIL